MQINYDEKGLVPAIIQDSTSKNVLMMGYMNAEAVRLTKETNQVTFYSRSKQRIWVKGETSGNFLTLVKMDIDCDNDTLLVQVIPAGPTCHKNTNTCWGESNASGFINNLEQIIKQRLQGDDESSYTKQLVARGINKVAQKVGEEAVEVVIEALNGQVDLLKEETADLLYHLLLLLNQKGVSLVEIEEVLKSRHLKK